MKPKTFAARRKRATDGLVASGLLVITLPLLLAIAGAILLTMGRPVLYRQKRIGYRERPFYVLKFRSMRDLRSPDGTLRPDTERLTRLGRFLRATSLDELPQLINVLRGEMSLVGPRPLLPEYLGAYTTRERTRHDVRPGITGWAQIHGRNQLSWDDRLELDARYVEQSSPSLDRRILRDTVWTVLSRSGLSVDPREAERPLHVERRNREPGGAEALPAGRLNEPTPGGGFVPTLQRATFVKAILHAGIFAASYAISYVVRFDTGIPGRYADVFWSTLPFIVPVRLLTLAAMGEYGSRWRHVSFQDATRLVKAVTISSIAFIATLYLTGQAAGFPRSIVVIDWMVTLLALVAAPSFVRVLHERRRRLRGLRRTRRRTLVVGAGNAAAQIVHQLIRSPDADVRILGLVDDDRSKRFLRLHGLPVLGTTADLPDLTRRLDIDLIVVAIASSSGRANTHRIVKACSDLGVEVKIVPTLAEILRGEAPLSELRDVAPEALLHREPIDFASNVVGQDLTGRSVLVTGAAGSIGAELVRQIAAKGPRRLVLLDQAESPLVTLHRELITGGTDVTLVPVVGDVTRRDTIEATIRANGPDVVFHAAAYKHVPVMEENVLEAVRNNVVGTLETALAAARNGASRFVLISTDKAVRPSSVMGATKRVAERLILGHPELTKSSTTFQAVRFGNVLGSAGSVVPLFQQQIAAGGPVTVTNPDMTRFFMTIPEAVQLVLLASSLPEARGRVSLLEMGSPVRILDMAEKLIRLSGFEPYTDIPITFTGTRPGEKLHEELMSDVEDTVPTVDERIRMVQTDHSEVGPISTELAGLMEALERLDEPAVLDRLVRMVPECVSPLRERAGDARATSERRLA